LMHTGTKHDKFNTGIPMSARGGVPCPGFVGRSMFPEFGVPFRNHAGMVMKSFNKMILLVDDDHDIMWGVGRCLTRAGFTVTTCADGGEAISLLNAREFDVLITDIRMPTVNGLVLIDWVRQNRPSMRIVVMTGFGSPAIRHLSLGKGAMLYLEKPVDPDLLIDALSSYEDKSAFAGSIDQIDILDYLQLMILTGRQVVLDVRATDGRHGVVFIYNGEIIHAISDDLEGEEALYRCLGFEGGTFSNLPWRDPEAVTIRKPGDFLLMEAARKRDEARAPSECDRTHYGRAENSAGMNAFGFVPERWVWVCPGPDDYGVKQCRILRWILLNKICERYSPM
jgi:ActR/RegA family two-component response regulator